MTQLEETLRDAMHDYANEIDLADLRGLNVRSTQSARRHRVGPQLLTVAAVLAVALIAISLGLYSKLGSTETVSRPNPSKYQIDPAMIVGDSWRVVEVDVNSRALVIPAGVANFAAFYTDGKFLGNDSVNDSSAHYELTKRGFLVRDFVTSLRAVIGESEAQKALEMGYSLMTLPNARITVRRIDSSQMVVQVGRYAMWCENTGSV